MGDDLRTWEVLLWTDAAGCESVGRLMDLMGGAITPIGVGGPRGGNEIAALGQALHCESRDDLRKLIVERPAAHLLLGTMEGASLADLQTATDQGTQIVSFEPVVGNFDQFAAFEAIAEKIHMVPAFIQSPGWMLTVDPVDALGVSRMIGYHSSGRTGQGSLYGRLWDAWHTVLSYLDLPQSIDAALAGACDTSPQQLAQLTGCLTAHGRIAEGTSVSLELTNIAARDKRDLHVIGETAELRVDDNSYQLHQTDGTLIDEGRTANPMHWIDLVADHWRRLLDRSIATPMPANLPRLRDTLACCLATLLSTRTGEPENPQNMVDMHLGSR